VHLSEAEIEKFAAECAACSNSKLGQNTLLRMSEGFFDSSWLFGELVSALRSKAVVGDRGLEPRTSSLSGMRSNHLS
jgi:hypothetical protein